MSSLPVSLTLWLDNLGSKGIISALALRAPLTVRTNVTLYLEIL